MRLVAYFTRGFCFSSGYPPPNVRNCYFFSRSFIYSWFILLWFAGKYWKIRVRVRYTVGEINAWISTRLERNESGCDDIFYLWITKSYTITLRCMKLLCPNNLFKRRFSFSFNLYLCLVVVAINVMPSKLKNELTQGHFLTDNFGLTVMRNTSEKLKGGVDIPVL